MSSTPSNSKSFAANTGLGIKLTPSNSPFPRTPRSPNKSRSHYDSGLSLKRIIGTTVSSPTGFDSLSTARIFAYIAGAAAVVVHLDQDLRYTQRFFRARPAAVPVIPTNLPSCAPSTPTTTANDSKNRTVTSVRDSSAGFSPFTPNPSRLEWNDSPSSKTWTSRERIKAATCLSISRDGRFLAVGETGYSPRVLIFSLHESSDSPLVILNEHTFGVKAVAFSPDQRFLASLGAANDGFLYLWSINPRSGAARLHSSNKCTSYIRGMVWMGNSLVTVGTRHVKIWRPSEDTGTMSPSKQKFMADSIPPLSTPVTVTRTLPGRNCLLGPLVETIFTCVAPISERNVVVCSEKGDICILDDSDGQKLVKVCQAAFGITCVAVDLEEGKVCFGGRVGQTLTVDLDVLLKPGLFPEMDWSQNTSSLETLPGYLCAMSYCAEVSVTIDSRHGITVKKTNPTVDVDTPSPFNAHCDPILGVAILNQPNSMDADFLTWSSGGNILFWDLDGHGKGSMQIEVETAAEEDAENQCQIIRVSKGAKFLVTGDRKGILTISDIQSRSPIFVVKAHGSEIQDIALHEGDNILLATCGRDRMVQLFRNHGSTWTIVQTMDEHTGSVGRIFFTDDGEKLISCSGDRTIQIRQIASREVNGESIIAAIPIKIITLKATPISMALTNNDLNESLIVSLIDRTVATFDISSGKLITSFRASDNDGLDAVVMDALMMGKQMPGRPTILAGISGTDKSVRVYDGITGRILDREWGHTSAVTDVALVETGERTILISTGLDSTIMIWELSPRASDSSESESGNDRDQSPPKDTTTSRPPLRKVLSRAELAEFAKPSPVSTPTGRGSPPRPMRRKTSKYALSTQSPKLSIPSVPDLPGSFLNSSADDLNIRRSSGRHESRSPPSPKSKVTRRPSLADVRSRTKSTGNFSEFGSLSMATEQLGRTLRAYRKKLSSSETIREEALRDLDQELRLTAKALGEKTLKTKAVSETVMAGLLDQYSERLVSIFDEKLRLTLGANLNFASHSTALMNGSADEEVTERRRISGTLD